jgi:3-(3-hydroxy-phenyl)propionate hydroxylase
MAQSLFQKADPRQEALRDLLDEVLGLDGAGTLLVAALITGLDVAYDLGAGHPLLGRRMPDLDIVTHSGHVRVFELLYQARPVLLEFGGPGLDAGAWTERVRHVLATYDGAWELPVVGEVAAPTAVLVRPDGHAGWVGEDSADGLAEALTTWCGAASR